MCDRDSNSNVSIIATVPHHIDLIDLSLLQLNIRVYGVWKKRHNALI